MVGCASVCVCASVCGGVDISGDLSNEPYSKNNKLTCKVGVSFGV